MHHIPRKKSSTNLPRYRQHTFHPGDRPIQRFVILYVIQDFGYKLCIVNWT